ncbi:hypothetical protein BCR34DRAFT_526265 [Clohesyomyces aquaticus]|uniref:Uncharacterized protein n=1 Tax=Clohesyomyces aquaticus TaxID=1231657 RepID=A0A1Y1Y708_9PLEO|nr:hypothetical protein BCR34DRAFT_526265 [Clohesyomyces aquaticus]
MKLIAILPVLASLSSVSYAAKGLTVDLYNDPTCSAGKETSWYARGVCYTTRGNRGIHVHPGVGCYLTVYNGDSCNSGDQANLDGRKCWDIAYRGSFKITCQ